MSKLSVLVGNPLSGKTTRIIEAYLRRIHAGTRPDEILCLSYFSTNVSVIRQALQRNIADFLPWVTTLQRFQTLLLRRYAATARLSRRVREINPVARGLLLRQAWAGVNGPLWREYGLAEYGPVPGAVNELVRVVDWVSQNRTGFRLLPDELGGHELAQVYRVYIDHCDAHGVLTFQEASLRCLDLLSDPLVARDVAQRFPVLLVDDLHLARPDQLALVDRLHGMAREFVSTAWLEADPRTPEQQHVSKAVQDWGAVERLLPVSVANPAIVALANRLSGLPGKVSISPSAPIELHTAYTVEDEAHAVAQSIVRSLLSDDTLQPEAIAVVAPNADLLPFVQRVLAEYSLPVAPKTPAVRRTSLVAAGLLALRRVRLGPDVPLERELLGLPFVAIDPLDQHALCDLAELLEKSAFALTPDEMRPLGLSVETARRLDTVRRALSTIDQAQDTAGLIEAAVTALGGSTWIVDDVSYPAVPRKAWLAAYTDWLRLIRELETTPGLARPAPAEMVDLVDQLTDQVALSAPEGGVQLVARERVNGVRARRAYVIGLSENATPKRTSEMQLITEPNLPLLFASDRRLVLPQARDQAAWLEREGRQLAAQLTRGTERLWLSTSRYTAAGDAQLPTPFFERLLGQDGEIDGEGNLWLTRPGLWQRVESATDTAPESWLPRLGAAGAWPRRAGEPERLLDGHAFSATQVRTYLTCPLQFFFARVLGIETEGSGTLDRGGLIHEVLCATVGDGSLGVVNLLDRQRPGWMNSAAELAARAQVVLAAAWTGEPVDLSDAGQYTPGQAWGLRFGPELQRQAVRRWAEGVLADWADYEVNGLPDRSARRPVLLEVPFTLELGDYRLRGRIDRIDEVRTPAAVIYEVIDYKTGDSYAKDSLAKHLQKFLPEGDKAAIDYQLPIYALALKSGVHGLTALPRRLTLINVEAIEQNKKGGYAAGASRTLELVDDPALDYKKGRLPIATLAGEVTSALQATMERMSASPYPAQPGFHCTWCPFRAACERGRGQGDTA